MPNLLSSICSSPIQRCQICYLRSALRQYRDAKSAIFDPLSANTETPNLLSLICSLPIQKRQICYFRSALRQYRDAKSAIFDLLSANTETPNLQDLPISPYCILKT
ncbi:hypothetical protein V6Z12_A03G215700 [Gossypium hirsutum]